MSGVPRSYCDSPESQTEGQLGNVIPTTRLLSNRDRIMDITWVKYPKHFKSNSQWYGVVGFASLYSQIPVANSLMPLCIDARGD